ncbi:30S ribosomal protein S1 [Phycisphaerae bacterium RAS1]|nr:30S ribosomal protein S1 [Phycisphaerae bacterium RAS1]
MSTDPQKFDDAEIKQQLEAALGGLSAEDVKKHMSGRHGPRHSESKGRIRGTIVSIRGSDVFVDIGGKSEGVLALDEFEPDQPPAAGQVFDLVPHGFDRESGLMRLSLSEVRLDSEGGQLRIGDVVKAKVTGTNIGGLELRIHGVRGFMPLSQVDIVRHDDTASFLNHWLECEVVEADRRGKSVVLSRRKLLERQREADRRVLKEQLAEGQTRKGVVRRIAEYGAFVDLGGIDGLLHVSDMSYSRVNNASEMVKVGDELEVRILKIDWEKDRVSLGMKQLAPDPWTLVTANFSVGATVDGKVTKLMEFGAFVELQPGVEGLIPVSEMSWTQRVRHPKDILNVGDSVRVSVLAIDPAKRKLTLSLKALGEDPWKDIQSRFQPEMMVAGAVTRIVDFGAFVSLTDGVEGLVHISQLSDQHVRRVSDVVEPGKVVQVRVLSVDPEQRRISLSMKSVAAAAAPVETAAGMAAPPPPPKKKRERPLRGGLTW